jgi:hypothetical protein
MIHVIDEHHLQVGDHVWWGNYHASDIEGEHPWKFRQFMVLFESKWRVSVIWGYCSYSDNHDAPFYNEAHEFTETPETVEAAILHNDRDGVQGGDVFAYLDAEQLNTLLTMVSQLATDKVIEALEL